MFSPKHDVSGSLQPERPVQTSETVAVHQCLRTQGAPVPAQHGLLAAVEVVKFLLGHGIVHVDSRKAQLTCL